jgi:hypothetical protein
VAIKNYTTKINPERTIAEIQSLLAARVRGKSTSITAKRENRKRFTSA